jgi:hypothetical protein
MNLNAGEENCSMPATGYLKEMFLEGERIFIDPLYGPY